MATKTVKEGDSIAGPATPAGPPIKMDRKAQERIADGEAQTRRMLAEAEQLELPVLLRSIWGESAHVSINGVSGKFLTGVAGLKAAKPFHDLLVTAQNRRLQQEAEAQARSGR